VSPDSHHGFLLWKAPGRLPSVKLHFDVIQRMTVDIMKGFGVTRRRGTEVGGVLLGKIETDGDPAVLINDYEAVACEYAQGPSYVLSAGDLGKFREAAERWSRQTSPDQYAVGYFRSHTRDGLRLDEVDVSQFHEHFKDPLAVALLVRPFATKTSEAGFFLQSNGRLETEASPREFPFVAAEELVAAPEIPVRQTTLARSTPIEPEIERPSPSSAQWEPPPRSHPRATQMPPLSTPTFGAYSQPEPPRWRTNLLWVAFTLAVFGFGALAGYQYAGGDIRALRTTAQTAPQPQAASDRYSAGLSAVIQDGSILVRWDKNSEAVRSALRGVLTITENAASRQVVLNDSELKNGTVLYHNSGPEIGFKLELHFKENRLFTETVTVRILPANVPAP
jgi:hypothetical protein